MTEDPTDDPTCSPVTGIDPHRVAEVIVTRGSGSTIRGSGYRVSHDAVLTAAHVVSDAASVQVRFDADHEEEWTATVSEEWIDTVSDIAVLSIPARTAERRVPAVQFGRIGDRADLLRVRAVGFPRFKLRDYDGTVVGSDKGRFAYRDSHQADGTASVLSNRRSKTLEITVVPPERDPDPEVSPWEGMSGAAVWVGDRIVGVLASHHRPDGLGRLEAARLDWCIKRLPKERRRGLADLLGLPDMDAIPDVVSDASGEEVRAIYRMEVKHIAPDELIDRNGELAELIEFCASEVPYAWWQGNAYAGKSALMSWFVLHPPDRIDVVSFFVTGQLPGQADSYAFTNAVTEQLFALLGMPLTDAERTTSQRGLLLYLLETVARQLREAGRRLLLIVDGLDEDKGIATGKPSIAALLPHPPKGVQVLVASRPLLGIPLDVPYDHPLRTCEPRQLSVSGHASGEECLAKQELAQLLSGSELQQKVVGFITAAGGLTEGELGRLTDQPPYEIDRLLTGACAHSLASRESGPLGRRPSERILLFAHETLRDMAVDKYGQHLSAYRDKIHEWANGYRTAGWPEDTPSYLLRDYFHMLVSDRDRARLAASVTDQDRHDRMLEITRSDAAALTEIATARHLLLQPPGCDRDLLAEIDAEEKRLADRSGVMTRSDVARRLKIREYEVDDLVREERLLPSTQFGPQAEVWERSDVERLLRDPGGARERETRDSSLLAPARPPLQRRHDVCIDFMKTRVHVRVWDGTAQEGHRVVVLVGALHDQINLTINRIKELAAAIDNRLLGGRGSTAVWFDYGHHRVPHRVANIILENARGWSWTDRLLGHFWTGHLLFRDRFVEPRWRSSSIAAVERVVGEPVECYPESAYTEATIERWKQLGRTVDVEHDPARFRPFLESIALMEKISSTDPYSSVARKACRLIANEIILRRDDLDTWSWDDGTTPRSGRRSENEREWPRLFREWPRLFAARLVEVTFTRDDRERISRYVDKAEWPWSVEEFARQVELLKQLERWTVDVGEFGDRPDPELCAAVQRSISVLSHWISVTNLDFLSDNYPDRRVWGTFEVIGEHDRRYLASIKRKESFAVDWPLRPPAQIPDDAMIVADGATGSRPVYIELPGGRLDLLPRQPDKFAGDWNFGYSGGEPGSLEWGAISRTFQLVDEISQDQVPAGWIETQVCQSEKAQLRISVRGIRQRYSHGGAESTGQ